MRHQIHNMISLNAAMEWLCFHIFVLFCVWITEITGALTDNCKQILQDEDFVRCSDVNFNTHRVICAVQDINDEKALQGGLSCEGKSPIQLMVFGCSETCLSLFRDMFKNFGCSETCQTNNNCWPDEHDIHTYNCINVKEENTPTYAVSWMDIDSNSSKRQMMSSTNSECPVYEYVLNDDDPYFYFSMDEVIDGYISGGPGFEGPLGTAQLVPGRVGNALHVNGEQSQDIEMTGASLMISPLGQPEMGSFTFAFWLWHEGPNHNMYGRFCINFYPRGFLMHYFQNHLRITFHKQDAMVFFWRYDFTFKVWYHFTMAWSFERGAELYENGIKINVTGTQSKNNYTPGPTRLRLGKHIGTVARGNCIFDDWKIWYKHLSSDFIHEHYMSYF